MHPLPDAALQNHIAILAKTGAGKSYAAQGIVERLLDDGQRVCVIDPTGRWWGLRSNAAGDGPGYPAVVFGGLHADVAIERHHGAALAEIVGTSNTPAIIDTRTMTVGARTRFFADFAEALLRANRGPLHLVIDEAHLFAPQGRVADPQSGKMLHAANNLVSLGRGIGLRIILISQRPAKLHKDSLTQVETLIAMRLIAPQDRKAVADWIAEWADPADGKEVTASLPSLPTGKGWIWAPEIGVLELAAFPTIRTYDSGRAPAANDGDGPVLAAIDLPAIEDRLGEIAAEAAENDPARLKARIAELERAAAAAPDPAPAVDADAVRVQGWRDGYEAAQGEALRPFRAELLEIAAIGGRLHDLAERVKDTLREIRPPQDAALQPPAVPAAAARPAPPRRAAAATSPPRESSLGAERRILKVLAQRHPLRFTEAQWATLSGLKRTGGTWSTYKSRLRAAGLIDQDAGRLWGCTAAGMAAAGAVEPAPRTPAEVREMWFARLGAERRMLQAILDHGPLERPDLARRLDMAASGGTFSTYLSRLRANGLIVESGGLLEATEELQ